MRFILYLPKRHIIMKIAITLSHSSHLALCYRMLNYSMVVLLASAVLNLKWLQFIVKAEGCFLMEFTSNGLIRFLSYIHALLELYMANTVKETNGGTCVPGLLSRDVTLFLITVDLLRAPNKPLFSNNMLLGTLQLYFFQKKLGKLCNWAEIHVSIIKMLANKNSPMFHFCGLLCRIET